MRRNISLLTVITLLIVSVAAVNADELNIPEDNGKLRIVRFGAHPDDAEYKSGGTAALWAEQGHHVLLVSVTNGDIGHWQMSGGELAKRRTAESAECAKRLGAHSKVLDIHDGELLPTLENRKTICRIIRQWNADIVISHRPWDYHPDHRYTGILVQDAAFMVTVPFFCPDVPHLKKNPVFLYSSDGFTKPYPFDTDIVVSLDSIFPKKVEALTALVSQAFEGGAGGSRERMALVPPASDPQARYEWLYQRWARRQGNEANKFREQLIRLYGIDVGNKVKFAEAFEICEYGSRPTTQQLKELFPFLPQAK
jgi:LmbE family N-acetylglucosaminyl deacetylase